ncbi:MAG: Holliday junction resolvase RuvX [Alphaproteobacteria bacterium]|nr:Holliday junction resolvase RuvX [Alphaproteobacteria bacterium]
MLKNKSQAARFVGLDVGKKTLGLAVSDARAQIATPLRTLPRDKFAVLVDNLKKALDGYDVCGFVVGLPLHMDGTESIRSQASRAFAHNLENALGVPVLFWDERLSTAAATWSLDEAGLARKRHKQHVDSIAASLILQGFLEALHIH